MVGPMGEQFSLVNHQQVVAEPVGLLQVVGHQQGGHLAVLEQVGELLL